MSATQTVETDVPAVVVETQVQPKPTRAEYDLALAAQITETVDDAVSGLESTGERNLTTGMKTVAIALYQRDYLGSSYGKSDFDNLCGDIRNKVRIRVPIEDTSIRVADWCRAWMLRDALSREESIGPEGSARFSCADLLLVCSAKRALYVKYETLDWSIKDEWMPFFVEVNRLRTKGDRDRKSVV